MFEMVILHKVKLSAILPSWLHEQGNALNGLCYFLVVAYSHIFGLAINKHSTNYF